MFLWIEPNSYIFCTKGGNRYWLLEGGGSIDHSPSVFIHVNQFSSPPFQVQDVGSKEAINFPRGSLLVDGRAGHIVKLTCL